MTFSVITNILWELWSEFWAYAENQEFSKIPFYKFHSTLPCKNFPLTVTPSKSSFLIYCVLLPYLSACKKLGKVRDSPRNYGQTHLADTLCFFIGQIKKLLTILDDINCVEIGDFELSPSVNFSSIHSRHGHNRIYSLS